MSIHWRCHGLAYVLTLFIHSHKELCKKTCPLLDESTSVAFGTSLYKRISLQSFTSWFFVLERPIGSLGPSLHKVAVVVRQRSTVTTGQGLVPHLSSVRSAGDTLTRVTAWLRLWQAERNIVALGLCPAARVTCQPILPRHITSWWKMTTKVKKSFENNRQ